MAPRTKTAVTGHRQVVVVDDDPDFRSALVELLSLRGISTAQAFDGVDAMQLVRSGPAPCAILLDVDMPRLSGPELVAALRADPELRRIPVITMTAGAAPQGLDTVGHLAKPFAPDAVLAALFQACRSCAACDGAGQAVGSMFAARRRADLAGEPAS